MPRANAARSAASAAARSSARTHLAMRADALVDLDDFLVEHRRQFDVPHEQFRPVLIGDAQRVGEAARGDEHRAIALALEQRIGGDRRAHFHGVDVVRGQRRRRRRAEQVADALDRRVVVTLRVFGQQLVRDQRAVGTARHDVRERAAAIDPELPARKWGYSIFRVTLARVLAHAHLQSIVARKIGMSPFTAPRR